MATSPADQKTSCWGLPSPWRARTRDGGGGEHVGLVPQHPRLPLDRGKQPLPLLLRQGFGVGKAPAQPQGKGRQLNVGGGVRIVQGCWDRGARQWPPAAPGGSHGFQFLHFTDGRPGCCVHHCGEGGGALAWVCERLQGKPARQASGHAGGGSRHGGGMHSCWRHSLGPSTGPRPASSGVEGRVVELGHVGRGAAGRLQLQRA